MNFSAPCNTPSCHGAPSSIFAARVHTALVNSECEPVVHRRAVCGSERLEVVLETIHPILLRASLAWIFPPDEFSVHQPLREAPGGLSGHGFREQKSPLSNSSFHALAPCLLEGLSVRKLSVGAALAAVPDNSQE